MRKKGFTQIELLAAPGVARPKGRPKRSISAFTLIELLVVIATIAVLAALFMPPLFLLESGDRITCAQLMDEGQVMGAVIRQIGAGRAEKPPRGLSPEEIFDLRDELLTPCGE